MAEDMQRRLGTCPRTGKEDLAPGQGQNTRDYPTKPNPLQPYPTTYITIGHERHLMLYWV